MSNRHYHYGAGLHGYLYQDGPHYADTYRNAVRSLVDMYELDPKSARDLAQNGYLELDMERDGNEYCEITDCEGDCPEDEE